MVNLFWFYYSWFRDNKQSEIIKIRLTNEARQKAANRLRLYALQHMKKWQKQHLEYRLQAIKEYQSKIKNPYFVSGLVIYWGEGDKKLKNGIVRVSNIDYKMLKIFILFLNKTCLIPLEKIKIWLLLYNDLDKKQCIKYWSKNLDIPKNQFYKPTYIKGREKGKKLSYGVCTVQVCNRIKRKNY